MSDTLPTLTESAPGYRPGRTLPFRVEWVRQLRRRRTLVMAALLGALPVILLIAFTIGGNGAGRSRNGATLLDTATASGANFAATCLFVSAGFLLVIPFALFFGDTVAGEADWSSLRYLLALPVPRARLLRSKLAVALVLSLSAVALLAVSGLVVGLLAYGWGPLKLPTGGSLPAGLALGRVLISAGYIGVSQLATAGLAFWLSTRTDAPLGAVGGAVGISIVGAVLEQVTALGSWRELLPAHWLYVWADVLQPDPLWSGLIEGVSVSVSYALVLFALAIRGFARKDIVS